MAICKVMYGPPDESIQKKKTLNAAFTWNQKNGRRRMEDTDWLEQEKRSDGTAGRQNDTHVQYVAMVMSYCLQQIE